MNKSDKHLENIQKILLQAQKNTLDRLYIPKVFKDIIVVKNGRLTLNKNKNEK
jgi:hypothetical protein